LTEYRVVAGPDASPALLAAAPPGNGWAMLFRTGPGKVALHGLAGGAQVNTLM
jgi:hypothetical protein